MNQEEHDTSTSTKAHQSSGTTKTVILVGDTVCKGLTAFYVYDMKPVYILSMATEHLKWIVKERKVYYAMLNKEEKIKFLRTDIPDNYNYNMNSDSY